MAATLRTPQIAALFSGLGGDVADLIRALVRLSAGTIDDESLPPDDDGEIAIVFHNDDFTTMDFVVRALNEWLAIPATEATALMLDVHRRGSVVVKTCPAREARWRIEKARRGALLWGMPLRITWRPATIQRDG